MSKLFSSTARFNHLQGASQTALLNTPRPLNTITNDCFPLNDDNTNPCAEAPDANPDPDADAYTDAASSLRDSQSFCSARSQFSGRTYEDDEDDEEARTTFAAMTSCRSERRPSASHKVDDIRDTYIPPVPLPTALPNGHRIWSSSPLREFASDNNGRSPWPPPHPSLSPYSTWQRRPQERRWASEPHLFVDKERPDGLRREHMQQYPELWWQMRPDDFVLRPWPTEDGERLVGGEASAGVRPIPRIVVLTPDWELMYPHDEGEWPTVVDQGPSGDRPRAIGDVGPEARPSGSTVEARTANYGMKGSSGTTEAGTMAASAAFSRTHGVRKQKFVRPPCPLPLAAIPYDQEDGPDI